MKKQIILNFSNGQRLSLSLNISSTELYDINDKFVKIVKPGKLYLYPIENINLIKVITI